MCSDIDNFHLIVTVGDDLTIRMKHSPGAPSVGRNVPKAGIFVFGTESMELSAFYPLKIAFEIHVEIQGGLKHLDRQWIINYNTFVSL
jgi:hypothetical protein